ncbi:type 4a pilus biogenesis protein PilO [Methylotenera sp.]|jgi:type IV pilus assembly protein PilO|uniref:Pilus assembly protein PilO n=1 Tax=Methylotenera mobilis TaxID=359408 RepID=A0A351R9X3_9PROT|nr:type 4a pilus biogenesis protein PilO [Methylotenera sp.]MDP3210160.1 type 4a pilus biogenesis protein PilO [Methylotenera sp.]PPC97548.1 MAG: pilus assembly protein PilO [Methylotenera sp.]PPD46313.1 MAG: pilus assembly protein PilO [Methylotenera sp.]HBA08844.1 pilus assembly protein PilO [Methylotenera mobilis]
MKLEDFNNIDINNAGNLPAPVKAVLLGVVFFVLLALGYYLVLSPTLETLDTEKAKEEELRKVYFEKKSQAINLEAYQAQMVEIEKTFGALLKQLPDRSQIDGLLTDINQAGLARGLEFELFKPGQETQAEFYAEMPISIKVTGAYHDLGAFATDISKLSRIVTLGEVFVTNKDAANKSKDVKAKPNSSDSTLVMEAVAKTYRYLDAAEIAEKRKAESEKAKSRKKGK